VNNGGPPPLVPTVAAARPDSLAGVWIAEDIEAIARGVEDGSWIDVAVGGVGATLDALAVVSDPVGVLLQYGVAWIIEHVKPLCEALDWLAGDPGEIGAHAQSWATVAGALRDDAAQLASAASTEVAGWHGSAADAYRAWADQQSAAIEALAKAAQTMAIVTTGAGVLVAGVRTLVRDAIATLVSRLTVYAAEEVVSLGTATPLVAAQVATLIASWTAKIAKWLRALLDSLRHLRLKTDALGSLVEKIKEILRRLMGRPEEPKSPVNRPASGPAGKVPLRRPNSRHNLNDIRPNSPSKQRNTIVLPGTDVATDLDDIAAGRGTWNLERHCYEVNGRSYGVETSGTVYPISGPGFVNLSRPAYKVLKQCIAADGDIAAAREALRRDPSVSDVDWEAALEVFTWHKNYKGGA
jgi:uncharacterized protein YukE